MFPKSPEILPARGDVRGGEASGFIRVISPPAARADEISVLIQMFALGLHRYHLRKPGYSDRQYEEILQSIPSEFREKVILHGPEALAVRYGLAGCHLPLKAKPVKPVQNLSYSTSLHSLEEIPLAEGVFSQAFLSPVFDSLSKPGYTSGFETAHLGPALARIKMQYPGIKLIALGGIHSENIEQVRALGFWGAALLGALWESENPLAEYKACRERLL